MHYLDKLTASHLKYCADTQLAWLCGLPGGQSNYLKKTVPGDHVLLALAPHMKQGLHDAVYGMKARRDRYKAFHKSKMGRRMGAMPVHKRFRQEVVEYVKKWEAEQKVDNVAN